MHPELVHRHRQWNDEVHFPVFCFNAWAEVLGTYPPARAILQILSCISLLAAFEEFPLIIRETVEMETPASFAISFNVIEIPPRIGDFHLCV